MGLSASSMLSLLRKVKITMSTNNLEPENFESRWEKLFDIFRSTDGSKRLWQYFLDLTKNKEFTLKVRSLRAEHGIPDGGFSALQTKDALPLVDRADLSKKLEQLAEEFGLHPLAWAHVFWIYTVFNDVERSFEEPWGGSLCTIVDMVDLTEEPFGPVITRWDNTAYPLAIRISPYASQTQIIDFIKKTYKPIIEREQERFRTKKLFISDIRRKREDIAKRNNFIYLHSSKPRKEIMHLLGKEGFEILDPATIGKIISNMNRENK